MVKEFVEYVVKKLVDTPEKVEVSVVSRKNENVLQIKVDEKDRGKVIGKEGQIIKSLRNLVSLTLPMGKKVSIEVQ